MIEILDLIIVTYLLIALVSFLFIPRNIVLAKNLIILIIISAILTFGYLLGTEIVGLLL